MKKMKKKKAGDETGRNNNGNNGGGDGNDDDENSKQEEESEVDEEESIAGHVARLETIFKNEFVDRDKEYDFVSADNERESSENDEKKSSIDELGDEGEHMDPTSDQYQKMLREFCSRVTAKEGGYRSKLEAYRRKKIPDPSIATYNGLGSDCDMQEVLTAATQKQARVTTVGGPAGKRHIERQPRVIIRGLTVAETEVVKSNHREKECWNQIIREELGPNRTQEVDDGPKELSLNEMRKRMQQALFADDFKRVTPTEVELRNSFNRWDRGIFPTWALDNAETKFPIVEWKPSECKPNVKKDHLNETNQHTKNRFISGSSMQKGFQDHWNHSCLDLADQALLEAKERAEKAQNISNNQTAQRQGQDLLDEDAQRKQDLQFDQNEDDQEEKEINSDNAVVVPISQTDSFNLKQQILDNRDVSTKTPNTDECSRTNKNLGIDEKSRDETPTSDLIRKTFLSLIKLPKTFVLRKTHKESLQPLDSDSQMSNSVVLTKLDGGGSYQSNSKGEEEVVGSRVFRSFDSFNFNLSPKGSIKDSPRRPQFGRSHPKTPRKAHSTSLSSGLALKFPFFRFFRSASISPSFDDPKCIEEVSEEGNLLENGPEPDSEPNPDSAPETNQESQSHSRQKMYSVKKFPQVNVPTRPPPYEREKTTSEPAHKVAKPSLREVVRRKFSDSNLYLLQEKFPLRSELEQLNKSNEFTQRAFLNPNLSVTDRLVIEALFRIQSSREAAVERFSKLIRFLTMGRFCKDDHLVYTADDLRTQALRGHYETVARIMNHWSAPSPNDPCHNGETPFYSLLMHLLTEDVEDTEHYALTFGVLPRLWKYLSHYFKRSENSNLALVLKIFDYRGIDVNTIRNQSDEENYAPVHFAARNNLFDLLKWLVARNVDINSVTSMLRQTPLMIAAEKGHGEMVHCLLHLGAVPGINLIDANGNTALHFAALHCKAEYVECLLLCGANISIRNNKNRLPIEEAKKRQRFDVIAVFSAVRDRSRMQKHRIKYYEGEVKKGRPGGADGGTITVSTANVPPEQD